MASAAAAPWLISILSSAAFGALSGATQPSNRNESFGFPANEAALRDFSNKLNNAYSGVNDYVKRDVTFPDATVQPLPTFSGGGLPMPIGTLAGPGTLSTPPSMKGIDFGASAGGFGRHDFSLTSGTPGDPVGATLPPLGGETPSDRPAPGGGGEHKTALPGGAQRQMFTDNSQQPPSAQPSVSGATPYAQLPYSTLGRSSTGQQSDPTHAALSLLYHAAGM